MRSDRYREPESGRTKRTKSKKSRATKVLFLLILLLFIAIPVAIRLSYKSTMESLFIDFTEEHPVIEIGTEVAASEYIAASNGDLYFDDDGFQKFSSAYPPYLYTDTPGEYSFQMAVERPMYGGILTPAKYYELKYEVVDSVPPLMLWSGDGTVLELGSDFDIKKVISYGDNADPVPDVSCDGSVDMDNVGTYPLHVTVTDASGNSTDWDLAVTVAEELPSYSDSSEGYPFTSFMTDHAGSGKSFGIDVSAWQGDIDFAAVKASGCDFVIIRIGYSHDGSLNIDDYFEQNYERAREAGLKIGAYVYSYDNSADDVKATAAAVLGALDGRALDLPVAFDWEDFGSFPEYEMSFIGLNKLYDCFRDEIESAGDYEVMLYGSKNYLEKVWTSRDSRPIWLAHYTDSTDYEGPYLMWQASSSGRIDGISGAVDMDILYTEQ